MAMSVTVRTSFVIDASTDSDLHRKRTPAVMRDWRCITSIAPWLGLGRSSRRNRWCNPARSGLYGPAYTVWVERLATKEEILKIIDELNDGAKHSDRKMLSGPS